MLWLVQHKSRETRLALLIYITRTEDWFLAGPDDQATKISMVPRGSKDSLSDTAQSLQRHIYLYIESQLHMLCNIGSQLHQNLLFVEARRIYTE